MMDRAETADVSFDGNVVRRIGEHHRRPLSFHQLQVCGLIQCTRAKDPVMTEQPNIAGTTNRRAYGRGRHHISRISIPPGGGFQSFDPQINLTDREAGRFQIEIEL